MTSAVYCSKESSKNTNKQQKTKQNHTKKQVLNPIHGVQRSMISVDNFFVFLRLLFFCFVVGICDLVHSVEATYGLP